MTALANSTKPIGKIIPVIYNLFQMTEAEKTFPNSFYEASITLILKQDKDITKQG